jgi:FkbM family methyltransferase
MIGGLLRLLPDFKGKRRLMRYLYKKTVETGTDINLSGQLGIRYLLPNLKESISFDIFTNGIYEPETNAFLSSRIPKQGIFLDLGANIGSITLPLIKLRPDLKVICVEAAPWIFRYLETNIQANQKGQDVVLVNKALLDRNGETLSFYSPSDQFGKGSLSPVFTNEAIPVISVTLEELIKQYQLPHVDMIKIDIEGYEYFAFKGAGNLLTNSNAPDILFEFVDWAEDRAGIAKGAAQQFLLDNGYKLFRVTENGGLQKQDQVVVTGSEMLFATKK